MDKTLIQTAWDAVLSGDITALSTMTTRRVCTLDKEPPSRPNIKYSNTVVRELLLHMLIAELADRKQHAGYAAMDLMVFIRYQCPQWVDSFVSEFRVDTGDMEDVLDVLYCAHHLRDSKPIPLLYKDVHVMNRFMLNAMLLDADVTNGPMLCEKYNLTTGFYDERPASCL